MDQQLLPISFTINNKQHQLRLAPWSSLLDVLRETLDLTGTKKGCDHGQCGACTVLVNGKRVLSCLTLAVMKNGAEITTVEGIAEQGELHPLQQAFIDHDAFQCGYCTPGQICSAVGLLKEGHAKTSDDITSIMAVAHNPGIQQLAFILAGQGDKTTLMEIKTEYPPCALTELSFNIKKWKDVELGMGILDRFVKITN